MSKIQELIDTMDDTSDNNTAVDQYQGLDIQEGVDFMDCSIGEILTVFKVTVPETQ